MPPNVPEFFEDITDGQWKAFRTAVGRKGTAVLLVHPQFDTSNDVSLLSDYHQKRIMLERAEYDRTIGRLVGESKAPIVVLEERGNVGATREWLAKMGAPNAIVVPTYEDKPYTYHCVRPFRRLKGRFFQRLSTALGIKGGDTKLTQLTARLKQAGVNTLLVGGMYAGTHHYNSLREQTRNAENRALARHDAALADRPHPRVDYHPIIHGCAGLAYATLLSNGAFKSVKLIPNALFGPCGRIRPGYFKQNRWMDNPQARAQLRQELEEPPSPEMPPAMRRLLRELEEINKRTYLPKQHRAIAAREAVRRIAGSGRKRT